VPVVVDAICDLRPAESRGATAPWERGLTAAPEVNVDSVIAITLLIALLVLIDRITK
jgi:hypothetical protein